ncbi:MAG: hypothetical protein IPH95_22085 [Candidatus Promineofilum sp.]|jgi:hypothetical protein|nr:hypothetical protein [Promineifilum sp.]
MQSPVQELIEASQQLTTIEQLQLLAALTESVYSSGLQSLQEAQSLGVLHAINRTPPVVDLDSLVADFWPENESADDFGGFIHQQRQAERTADL